MVNLLPLSSPDGALVHQPESTRSDLLVSSGSSPRSTQTVNHLVLKWPESVLSEVFLPLTSAQLAAMHRLVKRIAQLRSTSETATDSAEALLAYVSSEAQAVLMQWEQSLLDHSQPERIEPQGAATQQESRVWSQRIQPLQSLVPRLLWSIAKSTHEVVQLIEGVLAEVENQQARQTGVLRLVVMLTLRTEQHTVSLDLVTCQPASVLLPNGQIQIKNSLLAQQFTTDTVLLQQLMSQITATEPILEHFFQGFSAEWLIPNHDWQSGTLGLQLGFEFTPLAADSSLTLASTEQPSPMLRFTHPVWLEQHITSAVEHQLTQLLHTCRPVSSSSNSLVAVVQQGCAAIDNLQRSLTLASRTFAQQPLSLTELGFRLLWGINRTSYEVMQLTSGIRASLCQPNQAWSTGLLRLVVQLIVRTPEQTQSFDLVQRGLGCVTSALAATAIVQSSESEWCRQPVLLSDLEAMWRQQIEQNAPELVLLQSDTDVNIKDEDIWQNGVVQLTTGFEFITDGELAVV